MTLAITMLALAWIVPLTPIRRIVPSESVIALLVTTTTVASLYLLGQLA